MLGVNQLDFINYTTALKGNYRKGVHKLEAILANPTHAAEFAANLGGVSVVLGVPIGKEDKNSEALLSLLLASSVADDAVYTWLGQFYEFTSWDDLLGDAGRCQEMMADPFIWRAVANSGVAVGKSVATLAGLDCGAYADMTALAASSTAMTAVAASSTAMAAVAASTTARAAICASDVAFNHLLSLATYDTVSGTTTGSGWSTRYSKPCIVLQWCYSYQSGTSGIRTCLDGNASRQYTGSQRYNSSMGSSNYNDHNKKSGTYYKEFVFCSKLETYNSQGDWPAISIAYFKLP